MSGEKVSRSIVSVIHISDKLGSVCHEYEDSSMSNPVLYVEFESLNLSFDMDKAELKEMIDKLQEAYDKSKVRR